MARLLILVVAAAALAACSEAGPGGYGYAANERPTLQQLSITVDSGDDPFRADTRTTGLD